MFLRCNASITFLTMQFVQYYKIAKIIKMRNELHMHLTFYEISLTSAVMFATDNYGHRLTALKLR